MKRLLCPFSSTALVITLLSFSGCDTNKEKQAEKTPAKTEHSAATTNSSFHPQGVAVFKSKVKNGGGNPDYEVYSNLQKDKKELTITIVQTFTATEGKDGGPGSDIDIITLALPDIDQSGLKPELIVAEKEIFKDTAYQVLLMSKENKDLFKANYISRASGTVTNGTASSVTVHFGTKKAAEDFLAALK
jgi:hypothetical protein